MYFNFAICFLIFAIFVNFVVSNKKCYDSRYYVDGTKKIRRFYVPKDKVSWAVPFRGYSPPEYTSPKLKNEPYSDADIHDQSFHPKWNSKNGDVNRLSIGKPYSIVNGYPLNPRGRTGIGGRGLLKRWGPNHAADTIVTRWKRSGDKTVPHIISGKPVLQVIVINRKECHEWALPEGMVQTTEDALITAKRAFLKEALGIDSVIINDVQSVLQKVDDSFANGTVLYRGYTNDRRNTDNAWIETAIFHVHDSNNNAVSSLKLTSKKGANDAKWIDMHRDITLYTNRYGWLRTVAQSLKAHW